MRDSYEIFFNTFNIDKKLFVDFGLNQIIHVSPETAFDEWSTLKKKIETNQEVFIRGFGRNSHASHLFQDMYRQVLGNSCVKVDPTNNAKPTKMIETLCGLSKKNQIKNYQVSHVFGRTKNVYAFTAPWNVVFIPKVIDPFTGHEAYGDLVNVFSLAFKSHIYKVFAPLIEDFNMLMNTSPLRDAISLYLEDFKKNQNVSPAIVAKLEKSVVEEFSPISLSKRASN